MSRACFDGRRILPALAMILLAAGAAQLGAATDPPATAPPAQPETSGGVLSDAPTTPETEAAPQSPAPAIEEPAKPSVDEINFAPGDEIQVIVYRHDELTRTLHVPGNGVVYFPLVGEIDVTKMGLRQLRLVLTERLSKFILNPQVSLEMKVLQGQKIIILGEVKSPGVFHIQEPTSAIEAIGLAGGFTNDASLKNVFLVHDGAQPTEPVVTKLNLGAVVHTGALDQNPFLKGGELLYVTTTPLEKAARAFDRIWSIVRPIFFVEQGVSIYRNSLQGPTNTGKTNTVVIVPAP